MPSAKGLISADKIRESTIYDLRIPICAVLFEHESSSGTDRAVRLLLHARWN